MRTRFVFALLLSLIAFLTGCAGVPRSIEISTQQIQAALERRFPYEVRPGGLFTVTATAPHLRLIPEEDRLRLSLSLDATDRMLRRSVHGELAVSFGLRYEPSDASIRAVGARVEDIDVQGVSPEWQTALQVVGALVGDKLLDGTVLHTFRPEDIAKAHGWAPGRLRVTPTGILVELQPPPLRAGS